MKYDCLYVVGDSFAAGHEVDPKDCFATLVAESLNIPVINKGKPGSGNFYIFRTIYQDIYNLKSEGKNPLVIIVYTQWAREEFYINSFSDRADKGIETIVVANPWLDSEFFKLYYRDHFNDEYIMKKTLLYIDAIQNLLKQQNVDRIESFSMAHPEIENAETAWHILYRKSNLDFSRMLSPCLSSYAPYDRFHLPGQNKSHMPGGHLTEIGNKKVADWILSKIKEWYL